MTSLPPHRSSENPSPPFRIVFMGTPAIAAHVLGRLIAHQGSDFQIVGVVTRPDQPRNRGLKLDASEVGALASAQALPLLKPTKIRTAEFLEQLRAFAPDLLVVVAYGRILPNAVLEAARLMPINVHASLLPRHRGAAPIEGALLAGDRETGVTIMKITEQMDAGPILLQRALLIDSNETQGSLKAKLAQLGADALVEALRALRRSKLRAIPQDEAVATYTAPITKEQSVIDWAEDAAVIERKLRAFDPWPVARTLINAEELLLWRAAEVDSVSSDSSDDSAPGTIIRLKPAPVVKCGSGKIELIEVQAPGRRRIPAADYFRGRRVAVGTRLGA